MNFQRTHLTSKVAPPKGKKLAPAEVAIEPVVLRWGLLFYLSLTYLTTLFIISTMVFFLSNDTFSRLLGGFAGLSAASWLIWMIGYRVRLTARGIVAETFFGKTTISWASIRYIGATDHDLEIRIIPFLWWRKNLSFDTSNGDYMVWLAWAGNDKHMARTVLGAVRQINSDVAVGRAAQRWLGVDHDIDEFSLLRRNKASRAIYDGKCD